MVLMLENAWYSVISPEMCAQILWRDSSRASEAAEQLNLTAQDLKRFGIIDEIIQEPLGGAQRDPQAVAARMKDSILQHLAELDHTDAETLRDQRNERFRRIGAFEVMVEEELFSDNGADPGPTTTPEVKEQSATEGEGPA